MFPNARNSIRRWNDHGSSKIPIPIAATLHNLMTESSSGEKKWFRTEHDGNLLPRVRLEIFMEGGEVVYSSESRKSVHPSWEHLDERIDLPGEWWLEESYKSLKLRFTLLQTGINSAAVFLEVPLYPALLHRLNCTPETLPPNSCLVYFSDGSTRLPHNIFQLLFDSNLTEPVSAVEDFSRFEDDAFRVLDQVPHTPSRRERTASSLLEPDDKDLAESSTNLFPQQTELDHAQSVIIPFCDSEQVVIKSDMKKEREFLEAQIAQEEANIEKELDALKMVSFLRS